MGTDAVALTEPLVGARRSPKLIALVHTGLGRDAQVRGR